MILRALCDYYERKSGDADDPLAPQGLQEKEIPWVVVIDEGGGFVNLEDTREARGKRLVAKRFLVGAEQERSGTNAWKRPNLLWDNAGFALGEPKSAVARDVETAEKQHRSFVDQLVALTVRFPADVALSALKRFFERGGPQKVFEHKLWPELRKKPGNVSFRLAKSVDLISASTNVRAAAVKRTSDVSDEDEGTTTPDKTGICMLTGNRGVIARLHPRTPIPGSKSNAKIVSFQKGKGFDSYGKEQSFNAPVGRDAASAYTTALNHLLRSGSRQRMTVGDSTVVFWSEKASGRVVEDAFADWFDPPRDNPDANVTRVRALFEFRQGKELTEDDDQRFYVLGLAPNAARIAIRFWHAATIRHVGANIFRHFESLRIVRPPGAPEYPSLYRLLSSIAAQGDAKNIPPSVAGDWMRAILAGAPYPVTLLQAAIRRSRAEMEVGYMRASLIKATLNRTTSNDEEKLNVSLDAQNTNVGYRLGRLFAAFEKIQEEANPGLNATIRDRYYGSASASPVVAFPILNRLKNHHLAKLENRGRAVNFERLIGAIMDGLEANRPFPPSLTLADQGRFAVGYYHQRQNFFKTKTEGEN
jgi:CRISPR-associated protein Csd1